MKLKFRMKIKLILYSSKISTPTPDRILYIGQAFREKISIDDIYKASKIDKWFLKELKKNTNGN